MTVSKWLGLCIVWLLTSKLATSIIPHRATVKVKLDHECKAPYECKLLIHVVSILGR